MKNSAELKNQALEFLRASKTAVVSTVSKDGKPQAATVLYLIDDDFTFYFVTRESSRKFENLKNNKNIAAVIGTIPAPETVQLDGVAELVNEGLSVFTEKLSMNTDLRDLYYGPFLNVIGLDIVVFKVKPNWLRYLCLDLKTLKENYYQII